MITEDQVALARLNWIRASKELGFEIITPYLIETDSIRKSVFAFIPEYGSYNGTIV